jgi:hypothetical protein
MDTKYKLTPEGCVGKCDALLKGTIHIEGIHAALPHSGMWSIFVSNIS